MKSTWNPQTGPSQLLITAIAVCAAACANGMSSEGQADAGPVGNDPDGAPGADAGPQSSQGWALVLGGPGNDEAWGVTVGTNGTVYAVGVFSDEASFGNLSLSSKGMSDVFVTAVSSTGQVLWVHSLGGPEADLGQAITSDAAGNIYITGAMIGSSEISNGSLDCSSTLRESFVVSLTSDGDFRWAQCLGGDKAYGRGRDLDIGSDGTVYVTGWFTGDATFGDTFLQSGPYGPDAYVAALDSNGQHLWSRSYGGAGSDTGNKLLVDSSDGSVFVTGSFVGPAQFGSQTLDGMAGSFDTYLLKLDSSGTTQWLQEYSGPGDEEGLGLALSGPGKLGFAGVYEGPVTLGGATMTSTDKHDVFVAGLSTEGESTWATGFGGVGFDQALDMSSSGLANEPMYVSGRYDDALAFDNAVVVGTHGGFDGFVTAFSADGQPLWASTLGGVGNDLSRDVAPAQQGAVVVGVAQDGLVINGQAYFGFGGGDAYIAHVLPDQDLTVD